MNLPKGFENYFLNRWREEDVALLLRGLEAEPSVSIRLNPRVMPPEAAPLYADGRVPWCKEGIYLSQRPLFTADPLLHAGAYYVQEASSMFLAHVLRYLLPNCERPLATALDLCAAPGGKSTLLRSLLPDDCLLVSNEPLRARTQVLAENLAKWGHPHVLVTQAYAQELAPYGPFDLILADVPCSGEGMIRKEEAAATQWSPAFVAQCAELQRSIIEDIWPALQPGGILIYSTCTFNPEEDEGNVRWISETLEAEVLSVPTEDSWNIRGDLRKELPEGAQSIPCYHFIPGLVRGEGFFLAVLRKNSESDDVATKDFSEATTYPPSPIHALFAEQSHSSENSPTSKTATKKGFKPSPSKGKGKKKERRSQLPPLTTLPTNQLDLSADNGKTGEEARVELSLSDAIRYLQHESLILPPDAPTGIIQVCFHGHRLGLMKNLGSRANNLYPKEWRIRSGHITPGELWPQTDEEKG